MSQDVLDLRLRLHAAGYTPIPLYGKSPPNTKNNARRSFMAWEKTGDVSPAMLDMWAKTWPDAANTGILTKLVPAIDVDLLNPEAAQAIEDLARERFEEHGNILVRFGKPPKRAILLRTDEPFTKILGNVISPNGNAEKIEVLADGQQLVVFGTHPETQQPYRWRGGEPGQTQRGDLPYVREDDLREFIADAVRLLVEEFGYQRVPERPKKQRGDNGRVGNAGGGPADWAWLVDNIRNGNSLHDSLRDLSAKLTA
jgi:putative DNA primase/helicase